MSYRKESSFRQGNVDRHRQSYLSIRNVAVFCLVVSGVITCGVVIDHSNNNTNVASSTVSPVASPTVSPTPTPVPTQSPVPGSPLVFPTGLPQEDFPLDISETYNPVLVSIEDANDPIAEGGAGYFTDDFSINYTTSNIINKAYVNPAKVPAGTRIPGRVEIDGVPLVEYRTGNLPVLFVCIHKTGSNTAYMRATWPVTKRLCIAPDCDVIDRIERYRIKDYSPVTGDTGSGETCQLAADHMETITGKRPHLITPNLPKGILDFNRSPRAKFGASITEPIVLNHPELIATWDDFHSFVREAKNLITLQWGGGVSVDFHGQISAAARVFIGSGLSNDNYEKSDEVLTDPDSTVSGNFNNGNFRYSARKLGLTALECIRGEHAFGTRMGMRGIAAFPSATNRINDGKCFCTGGDFSSDIAKNNQEGRSVPNRPHDEPADDVMDSFQMETFTNYMKSSDGNRRREQYAKIVAESMYDMITGLYKFNIARTDGDVDDNDRETLTNEQLAEVLVATGAQCAGEPLAVSPEGKSLRKNGLYWTPEECIAFCVDTPTCEFVDLHVPSFGPKDDRSSAAFSECRMFKTCNVQEMISFNVYKI